MSMMLRMATGLAAFLALVSVAHAGDQGDGEQSCDGNTYQMVECLKAKTAQWDKRLNAAYQKALGRPPKSKEAASLAKFLGGQRAYYKENPDDAKKLVNAGVSPAAQATDETELAAWTQVCRVVLNLHESVTRY